MGLIKSPYDAEFLDDGKRYRVVIDSRSYYVIMTPTSVQVAYSYENREEDIKTRTVLEKFCQELSKIMEHAHVQKAGANTKPIGNVEGIEVKDSTSTQVC